jgi:hypothetical protein
MITSMDPAHSTTAFTAASAGNPPVPLFRYSAPGLGIVLMDRGRLIWNIDANGEMVAIRSSKLGRTRRSTALSP